MNVFLKTERNTAVGHCGLKSKAPDAANFVTTAQNVTMLHFAPLLQNWLGQLRQNVTMLHFAAVVTF